MQLETQLPSSIYEVDRPLHHQLALSAYSESFRYSNLSEKYEATQLRRLNDVFTLVSIADLHFPSIQRPVDTFDLTNPYQAGRIREACYRDLPGEARAIACLKAIHRYCQFLKECPTIHLPGQKTLYLPEVYGSIESPVNRFTFPRIPKSYSSSRHYLEKTEYEHWLCFTWSKIEGDLPYPKRLKANQLHLMCVIAGEMGLRLQEILGLQIEHFALKDATCLVAWGKGSRGSGYRKRIAPVSELAQKTLGGFLQQFPRAKGQPLFQSLSGQRLSKHTAHGWLDELIQQVQAANLPILIEKGFGWHAFRRTFARLFIENGGSFANLKRITGWAWDSTAEHYLGDAKPKNPAKGIPLYPRRALHD